MIALRRHIVLVGVVLAVEQMMAVVRLAVQLVQLLVVLVRVLDVRLS